LVPELLFLVAQFVESLGFEKHPRVGARHARNREHADDGAGQKNVYIVQRYWNLTKMPLGIASYEKNVKTFAQNFVPLAIQQCAKHDP
jgi:hypothetical protein